MSLNLRKIVEIDRVEMENRTMALELDNQHFFALIETQDEKFDRQIRVLSTRIECLEKIITNLEFQSSLKEAANS